MKTYKGFNKDLRCRGFQYEVGNEYETDQAEVCKTGFHACENPLDCFSYYPPGQSVFHEVEQDGEISRSDNDSKIASTRIKIGAKISVQEIISATFDFVKKRTSSRKRRGDCSAVEAGYESAVEAGDCSVVYAGDGSKVCAGLHSVIAIQFWKNNEFQCIKFAEVDGKKIMPNTYYKLDKNGEFAECEE